MSFSWDDYPRGLPVCLLIMIFASVMISGFILERIFHYASYIGFALAVLVGAAIIIWFGYNSLRDD